MPSLGAAAAAAAAAATAASTAPLLTRLTPAAARTSVLALARPPVNALNTALLRELTSRVRQAERDAERGGGGGAALVLTSDSDSVFTSGLDLTEMIKPERDVREFWGALQELFLALYGTPLVTVCALAGTSPAGGCLLAMACDYRVAASDAPKARIGLNEAKFGLLAPPWFARPLADCVGVRRADKMLQLGELLGFADAHRVGLVDELVPKADVLARATQVAEEWVANGPAEARHASKLVLRAALIDWLTANRAADADLFVGRVLSHGTQRAVSEYLASLGRRGPR